MPIVLSGLPGVGKTSIAIGLARKRSAHGPYEPWARDRVMIDTSTTTIEASVAQLVAVAR